MSLRVFYAYLSFMQAYLNCLAAEDGTVRWHHRLSGHEFEQALGDCEGQGSPVCCSPWGRKGLDTTERRNNRYFPHSLLAASVLLLI